jgi:hypothetical protein
LPVSSGLLLAKSAVAVVPSTTPQDYRLTFVQMFGAGPIPACTTLPCPQYTLVLSAIGLGGTSVRGVVSESAPFTAAVPTEPPPPGAPTNLRLN